MDVNIHCITPTLGVIYINTVTFHNPHENALGNYYMKCHLIFRCLKLDCIEIKLQKLRIKFSLSQQIKFILNLNIKQS